MNARPTIQTIKAAAALHFGIEVWELSSRRRTRNVVRPRRVAMAVAHRLTGHSLPEIGRAFEKDHTTVLHAVRTIANELYAGGAVAEDLAAIAELIDLNQPDRLDEAADALAGTIADKLKGLIEHGTLPVVRKPRPHQPTTSLHHAARRVLKAAHELDQARFGTGERHALDRLLKAAGELGQHLPGGLDDR